MSDPGYVYVVSVPGFTKVGYTNQPRGRLAAYISTNPYVTSFSSIFDGSPEDERQIHAELGKQYKRHLKTEWFRGAAAEDVELLVLQYFSKKRYDEAERKAENERCGKIERRSMYLKELHTSAHAGGLGLAKYGYSANPYNRSNRVVHLRAISQNDWVCDWPSFLHRNRCDSDTEAFCNMEYPGRAWRPGGGTDWRLGLYAGGAILWSWPNPQSDGCQP